MRGASRDPFVTRDFDDVGRPARWRPRRRRRSGPPSFKCGPCRRRDLLSTPIGAQADYVALNVDAIAPAPRTVPPAEAATIPLNGLTAAQALDLLGLRDGQSLLVTGAAGALEGFAVQLAALRGLRTIAVASPGDAALVHELGAHEFLARPNNIAAAVRGVVPGGVYGAIDAAVVGVSALDAVRDGGSFVAVAAGAAPLPLRGTRVHNVWRSCAPRRTRRTRRRRPTHATRGRHPAAGHGRHRTPTVVRRWPTRPHRLTT